MQYTLAIEKVRRGQPAPQGLGLLRIWLRRGCVPPALLVPYAAVLLLPRLPWAV